MENVLNLEAIEDVVSCQFLKSGREGFIKTYENNRKALLSYALWRNKKLLPPFDNLPIIPICIGSNKYVFYDKNKNSISYLLIIKRQGVTKKFF